MNIILLIAAIIFCIVAVFFLNWFWRLLAIPMVLILAYDVISSMRKKS